ncbi:MAG: efflux RND transporter periplasmic adaptor subunit [Candidatus Omnitrophota bacterium]
MEGKEIEVLSFARKFLNDNRLVIGIGLLVVLAFVVPFLKGGTGKKAGKTAMPPRPVRTATAARMDVPVYLDSFGTLSPIINVDVRSRVTGQIKDVHFESGDEVKAGDLLFSIDPQEFKAEMEKAEAMLEEDIVDLKLKRDTFERNRGLFEKGLISQQDFDQYQTDVAGAEARVRLDKAGVDLAKIDLDYCCIKAPAGGLTGQRLVDPGNIITADNGPVLVNIKTIDTLYMDFTLPEKDLPDVRRSMSEGQLKVEIMEDEKSDGTLFGELEFLDNTVDDRTGVVLLRAIINNERKKLWAGQFVKVRLILGTEKDAVTVPYQAVQIGQKGYYLFAVAKGNKADLRQLIVGEKYGDDIIIKRGAEAGEKVVTMGQMGLSPGASVIELPGESAQAGQE